MSAINGGGLEEELFMKSSKSKPDPSAIFMSERMMSGKNSFVAFMASNPPYAIRTVNPFLCRSLLRTSARLESSSTTRILGEGFAIKCDSIQIIDEFSNRVW